MTQPSSRRFDTLGIHGPQERVTAVQSIPSLWQDGMSVLFDSSEHQQSLTLSFIEAVERRCAALESAESSLFLGTGLSTAQALITGLCRPGDEAIVFSKQYGCQYRQFALDAVRFGVRLTWVKEDIAMSWESAIRERTRFIYIESLGSASAELIDIPHIAAIANRYGVPLIIENALLTAAILKPLLLGANLVVYSNLKFLAGQPIPGASLVMGDDFLIQRLRKQCPTPDTWRTHQWSQAFLSAWQTLSGLETLTMRMERHCQTAATLAEYLAKHPQVSYISYPGFIPPERVAQESGALGSQISVNPVERSGHPQNNASHGTLKAYGSSGNRQLHQTVQPIPIQASDTLPFKTPAFTENQRFGPLLAFSLKRGAHDIRQFLDALTLCKPVVTVGKSDLLNRVSSSKTHFFLPYEHEQGNQEVSNPLLYCYAGLENVTDILLDIDKALPNPLPTLSRTPLAAFKD